MAAGALILVALGYFFITQVVTVRRIRQQVERLPHFSLVSLMPAPTPSFTPAPTRETETRPTPTRIPTGTPVPSETPLPPTSTVTPTLTATRTARPATSTPLPASTDAGTPTTVP